MYFILHQSATKRSNNTDIHTHTLKDIDILLLACGGIDILLVVYWTCYWEVAR